MIEIDQGKCCGCNYCVIFCNQEALSYKNYQIVVDLEKCENCGACYYYCPNKAIRVPKKSRVEE